MLINAAWAPAFQVPMQNGLLNGPRQCLASSPRAAHPQPGNNVVPKGQNLMVPYKHWRWGTNCCSASAGWCVCHCSDLVMSGCNQVPVTHHGVAVVYALFDHRHTVREFSTHQKTSGVWIGSYHFVQKHDAAGLHALHAFAVRYAAAPVPSDAASISDWSSCRMLFVPGLCTW
jgi:hypothetical protein